jgi:cardiolipin synthase
LIQQMQAAGVHFLVYRPQISPWTLKRARLRRLHRKLAMIDARTAFVGGINIIDDEDTERGIPPRFDYAVRVEGPLVASIYPVVKRLWRLVSATQLRARRPETRALVPNGAPRGKQRAAFLIRDNLKHRREIEDEYLAAIGASRSEILIASAYFIPGISFRRALMDAAARGVRVKLMLQGRPDHLLFHYASRARIEIHEYPRSFLHAKVAVIDGHWSTVGSSNIDPFSLLLAREANVVIEDSAFADQLWVSLTRAMDQGATQLKREGWTKQPLPVRVATWMCYGVTRFLTGVFAYGRAEEFA